MELKKKSKIWQEWMSETDKENKNEYFVSALELKEWLADLGSAVSEGDIDEVEELLLEIENDMSIMIVDKYIEE